jgi:hypothetical protein
MSLSLRENSGDAAVARSEGGKVSARIRCLGVKNWNARRARSRGIRRIFTFEGCVFLPPTLCVSLGRLTGLHNCGAQSLLHNDIAEIMAKIEALDGIRNKLGEDLLKLQEDELELDDECK